MLGVLTALQRRHARRKVEVVLQGLHDRGRLLLAVMHEGVYRRVYVRRADGGFRCMSLGAAQGYLADLRRRETKQRSA